MARPDIEYMLANGYDTPERALVSMIEQCEEAKRYLAERDELKAAYDTLLVTHEESIIELKARVEQCEASQVRITELEELLGELEAKLLEQERWLKPDTVPPPTNPDPNVTLTEPEGT